MIKGYKIQIFPTPEQEKLLWQNINASRSVWNKGIDIQENSYKQGCGYITCYDLQKIFVQMKKQPEYQWLNQVSKHTVVGTCIDLDHAYKMFFNKELSRFCRPKFKSRKTKKASFPVRTDRFYLLDNVANIEKVGKIKYKRKYDFPIGRNSAKFYNVRISNINGKWLLSFGLDVAKNKPLLNDYSVGIDLGIKNLAIVAYDDNIIEFGNINKTAKMKRLKSKLKHLQREQCRKYTTNNNLNKYAEKYYKSNQIKEVEKQIADIHKRIVDIRKNYIHQITSQIIKLYPKRVVMEDLNIEGMKKNRHLSRAISEQCFYEFRRQMEYKCQLNGIEFVLADRYYPSSKTCSCCGTIKKDLKLSDRIYYCPECGMKMDRDANAAINLMNYIEI